MSDANELNTLEIAGDSPPEQPPEKPEDKQAPQADTQAPPEQTTVDEPPDPVSLQADIEKLEQQRKKAQEDAKYWRQQKAQARADYFKSQKAPEPPPEAPAAEAKPDPNTFDDYNDYVDALTDWKVEQKRRAWEKEAAEKEASETYQQKQARLQEKINEGYSRYEDFEEIALDNSVPITPAIVEILAESDMPADVAYYLGKNRTEAVAISRMTPIAAARAIARIESELATAKPATKKNVTSAPPPIKPVNTGGSAAITKDPAKMTQKEFEQWRESQGARRF